MDRFPPESAEKGAEVWPYGASHRPGVYSSSIQKVSLLPTVKRRFPIFHFCSLSSSSGGSSCSSGFSAPSSGSADTSFRQYRAEASSILDEIADMMVHDGYTQGLIQAFSESRVHGSADPSLQTLFGELDVAWVLDVEAGKNILPGLEEEDQASLHDLVHRWSRALTVMVKVFQMTWLDIRDKKLSLPPASGQDAIVASAVMATPRSAPTTTGLAARKDPSAGTWGSRGSLQSTDDESASSGSGLSVKSVRDAMSLYYLGNNNVEVELATQFAEFAQACVLRMLSFADTIAGVKRTRDNLLPTLDAYASVSESAPLLLHIFTEYRRYNISAKIDHISHLLSNAVRVMIGDAKESIISHVSASPEDPSGCDIPETVRCAMNDITLLFYNYRSLNIFLQRDDHDDDDCIFDFFDGVSTLSYMILELISCLEDSIAEKSKVYSDRALRYMFLLNNSYFILEHIEAMDSFWRKVEPDNESKKKRTDLTSWVWIRKKKIECYMNSYIASSWVPVTSCLSLPRKASWPYKSPSLVRFNHEFKRTYDTQKLWKVPSPRLRKQLREIISKKVIQDYITHSNNNPGPKNSGTYTPEEIKQLLAEIFEG